VIIVHLATSALADCDPFAVGILLRQDVSILQRFGRIGRRAFETRNHSNILEVGLGEFGIKVGHAFVGFDQRFERRSELFLGKRVKIDIFEERVLFEILCIALGSQTVTWITVEQTLDKLLAVVTDGTARKLDFAKADVPIHLLCILCVEGRPATTHFEKQNPEGPEVDEFRVARFVEQHFGSQVFGGSAKGVGKLTGAQVRFAETEITQGDVASGIEQNVFGLEIAVDDIVLVQMFEGEDEFGNVESSAFLGEATLALQVPEELASGLVVGDKVELGGALEREFETDEEGAVEGFFRGSFVRPWCV